MGLYAAFWVFVAIRIVTVLSFLAIGWLIGKIEYESAWQNRVYWPLDILGWIVASLFATSAVVTPYLLAYHTTPSALALFLTSLLPLVAQRIASFLMLFRKPESPISALDRKVFLFSSAIGVACTFASAFLLTSSVADSLRGVLNSFR